MNVREHRKKYFIFLMFTTCLLFGALSILIWLWISDRTQEVYNVQKNWDSSQTDVENTKRILQDYINLTDDNNKRDDFAYLATMFTSISGLIIVIGKLYIDNKVLKVVT